MSETTTFSLNYQFTADDGRKSQSAWRKKSWNVAGRVFTTVSTIILLAMALWAFLQGRNDIGLGLVVCAILLQHTLTLLAVHILFRVLRPQVQVVIDDIGVSQQCMGNSNRLYWSMLVHSGEAVEHPTFFAFRLLMQPLYIPKRAFDSEVQMQAFREFVRSKMGERCRFTEPASSGT